jgi:hypothetical protein
MRQDECSEQEQWVLEQVEQGEKADLKKQFGEVEDNRRLRAEFLEALLRDEIEGFEPRRQVIRIAQAVIGEPLNLENAEVAHIVSLYCVFEERVNFRDARFKSHLFLNGCRFLQKANFHRMQVDLGLLCRRAVFQGPVDFRHCDIGKQFSAMGARFEGQGEKDKANFISLKVGRDAIFDNAIFQGPVDFGNADIGRQFRANGAQFQSEKEEANFNSMKVGQNVFFRGTVFNGPVDFQVIRVTGHFDIRQLSQQHSIKQSTLFKGPVVFSGADIGGTISADEAQFKNEKGQVKFNSLKVGQSAYFRGVVFQGHVDFTTADISGHFSAQRARFLSKKNITFEGFKVGRSASFEGTEFAGPVALNYAHLLDLLIGSNHSPILKRNLKHTLVDPGLWTNGKSTKKGKFPIHELNLDSTTIYRKLRVRKHQN